MNLINLIKLMKLKYILSSIFAVVVLQNFNMQAQQKVERKQVVEEYDRSAISLFVMRVSNDSYTSRISSYAPNILLDDKFYPHNLPQVILNANYKRITESTSAIVEMLSAGQANNILSQLNEMQAGRQIVEKWYNRKPDGTMGVDVFQERGLYNATDADFKQASGTKIGISELMDSGEKLIAKSYVLVLDYIQTKSASNSIGGTTYSTTLVGYLYKIKFTEDDMITLYENYWITEDDSPEVKARKIEEFNKVNYPLQYVTKIAQGVVAMSSTDVPKSGDQLLAEIVQGGYDNALYALARKVEDFRVKTPLYTAKPLQAKIGKKESLKTDQRYFAYEYVYNETTNTAEPKRRGIVRATSKIVDNRQVTAGESESSKFYQVSGRQLEEGYLLQQRNDFGIGVYGGYEVGSVGGFNLRLDYRAGRFIGVPGLYVYGSIGMSTEDYTDFGKNLITFKNEEGTEIDSSLSFFRYDVGLAKSFAFLRNFEITPFMGLGAEGVSGSNLDTTATGSIGTSYFRLGTNLAVNLWGDYLQFFAGASYYAWFKQKLKNDDEIKYVGKEGLFEERGNIGFLLGLRLQF